MHARFESNFFFTFKEEIMIKSHKIKSNHKVLSKNKVDTYGTPVFAPVYGTTVVAAKICTNSD